MNGVHDLGGMHGFGPIEREADEPLFHAAWEARVRAIASVTRGRGYYNIDAFRHGIERMAPAEYLRASYFERWLASVETNLIDHGLLTGDELEARTAFFREHPGADPPPAASASAPPPAASASAPPPGPAARPAPPASPPAARFAVGDAVVTRNVHPTGHTRLPRYARGKRGVVHAMYGPHTFPDTNAHGLGEQPHALYSVRFEGSELWGESTEPRQAVYIDLWESYLEAAPA